MSTVSDSSSMVNLAFVITLYFKEGMLQLGIVIVLVMDCLNPSLM